jgi:hypothetical protein
VAIYTSTNIKVYAGRKLAFPASSEWPEIGWRAVERERNHTRLLYPDMGRDRGLAKG